MSKTVRLKATPERLEVYERCKKGDCTGCPYKYRCEEPFPPETPWKRFTLPTDYRLVDGYFIIEEQ